MALVVYMLLSREAHLFAHIHEWHEMPCHVASLDDRFVELLDCDYVLAATFRHYESRGNRASRVMLDMMKEKELWETVSLGSMVTIAHMIVF